MTTPETLTCIPPNDAPFPAGEDLVTRSGLAYKSLIVRFPRASGETGMATALTAGPGPCGGELLAEQYLGDVDVAFAALVLNRAGEIVTAEFLGREHPAMLSVRVTSPPMSGRGWAGTGAALLRLWPAGESHVPFEELAFLVEPGKPVEGVVRLADLSPIVRAGVEPTADIEASMVPANWSDDEVERLRGLLRLGRRRTALEQAFPGEPQEPTEEVEPS